MPPLGTSREAQPVTWLTRWSRLCFSLRIWPSCCLWGGMRSSSSSRDILLWYVLLPGPFFFSLLLFSLLSSLSFSNPYFFPWQAVQASFWVKEITNYYHRQMKEDEGRRNVAVKAFNVVKKSNQELKKKLLEKEREREKKKVQQLLLTVLRSKSRAKGCCFATLRISWPPLKLKSLPWRRNWRRPRRQGSWLRRHWIRPSRMVKVQIV